MIARPTGIARRMTSFVERYKNWRSIGVGTGSGRRSILCRRRRMSKELSRSPRTTMAAGVTITAAAAANATVAMPE